MRKIVISFVVIVVVALFCAWGVFEARDQKMEDRIEAAYTEIDAIDLNQIPDGVYPGRFGDFLVDVTLEVTIKDQRIVEIAIKKQKCGKGYDALETIDQILRLQNPRVDWVSGATLSSKCIMIATHQALRKE